LFCSINVSIRTVYTLLITVFFYFLLSLFYSIAPIIWYSLEVLCFVYQFIWAGTATTVGKLVSTSTIPIKQRNPDDITTDSMGSFRRSICREMLGRGNDIVQFWKLSFLPHSKLNVPPLWRPVTWNCSDKYFLLILGIIWNVCTFRVWCIGTIWQNLCGALNGSNTQHQFKFKVDLLLMKIIFPWTETYFWFFFNKTVLISSSYLRPGLLRL
jgi:hypothetical protein